MLDCEPGIPTALAQCGDHCIWRDRGFLEKASICCVFQSKLQGTRGKEEAIACAKALSSIRKAETRTEGV
jgi:hypothetical protein